ncbi:Rhamnolipids biosynthesis 3-oxoacyl-[acyl-carrier-protein] reductase [Alphaproteobacteria bacterium SO-S41]|nr:Rhamnolipids biosynthesis 3-oxoacyl-[acyl-carrier-protein] reductase [Alphaproteobacteria bacterium SO-S41]
MSDPASAQLFRLDGRIAFVSGGAGHLGEAMVRGLCAHGAHVIVNGRNEERLKAFQTRMSSFDCHVSTAAFDMMDFAASRAFFGGLERLDVLVNNAVTMEPGKVADQTPDQFDIAYRSTVTAAFEAMRAAEPALKAAASSAGHASVINIATMYAHVAPDPRIYGTSGLNSPPAYGPAKAGLLQLTRHMAAHWGPERIRVNSVSPGPFPNPNFVKEKPDFAATLASKTMLGRIGASGEIAGAVVFLAGDAASFVTGTDLRVDGGWTSW